MRFSISGNRDIDIREIRSHDDMRSGIFMVEVPGTIQAVRLWGHMAEIEISRELRSSQGESPNIGYSKSRGCEKREGK